ncbi:sulfotransferase, putative, partial [Ixodes scapularis]
VGLGKKLFSTVLFGGTLATALYLKRRRRNEQSELFKDCVMLPRDENYAPNLYLYNYRGYVFPAMVIKSLPKVQTLKARPDDVFVVSFPKTGTTWVQEIVYLISTNLDFRSAAARNLEQRFPFLEYCYPGVSSIEKLPNARLIKSHLPHSLLPESVHTENPKSQVIHCCLGITNGMLKAFRLAYTCQTDCAYNCELINWTKLFCAVAYGPIWKHYLEWWEHRNDPNVLVVSYEELHKDVCNVIQRIALFLERPLRDDEVNAIAEHCRFTSMAANNAVNYEHWKKLGFVNLAEGDFMRKG